MTTLTLAHDLMLLSLDPETGQRRRASAMGFGMVGALLAELALSGRFYMESKKVRVVDPSPTGEPRTDDLLSRLVTDTPRKPQAWAQKLQNAFTKEVLTDLCTAELVRREESRFLGLMWDTSRYPQLGGAHRDRLLTDLRGVMVGGLAPTAPRVVALGSLVVAVDLHPRVFPGARKRELRSRLRELDRAGWASEAVRRAIEAAAGAAAAGGAGAGAGAGT